MKECLYSKHTNTRNYTVTCMYYIEIYVLCKTSITNKLVKGGYSFFISSFDLILITSFWAPNINLILW